MNEPQQPSSEEEPQRRDGRLLTGFRLTVDLIKALLWPVITIFIFVSVKTPLLLVLNQLPDVLSKSTNISVAGVSVAISRSKATIPVEVRSALAGLSTSALRTLLVTGNVSFRYLDKDWEQTDSEAPVIRELEKKGLLKIKESGNVKYPFEFSATPLGKSAYDVVLQVLLDQLLEKSTPQ